MNRCTRIGVALLALVGLGGCASTAPFGERLAMAQGPAAEVTGKTTTEGKMQCVASNLTRAQRSIPFGVIAAPDRTGKQNIAGNDATGAFNTQGAADMIISSLGRSGVRIVELGPDYRAILDWNLLKASQGLIGDGKERPAMDIVRDEKGNVVRDENGVPKQYAKKTLSIPNRTGTVFPVRYGVYGAITSLDFMPGGGVSGGAYGATAGYNQNRANIRIDLRLVQMPVGENSGGQVVATTTVEKQVVNDGVQVQLSRYFGAATPVLVNFEAGAQRREALQLSTGAMLDLAVADLLEQVFMKKHSPCANNTIVTALY